jgi:hypothetical protein
MVYYPQEKKPIRGHSEASEMVLRFRGAFHKASPRLRLKSHNHEKVSLEFLLADCYNGEQKTVITDFNFSVLIMRELSLEENFK